MSSSHERSEASGAPPTDPAAAPLHELPEHFTLELTPAELAFLRLLVTNATVQPAELKKLCGDVQLKIEAQIGPLPP
jgi:hypothetical protein